MENILYFNNSENKVFSSSNLERKYRISNKKMFAPTIQLKGHKSELFSGKFSKNGLVFSSAGFDKIINLWDVFDENCRNVAVLDGHTNAVTDLCWFAEDTKLLSSSADKNVFIWDVTKGERIKKLKGHENVVNSVFSNKNNSNTCVSSGEDGKLILWDLRIRKEVLKYSHKYQLTSALINNSNDQLFFTGIDNQIHAYNIKMNKIEYSLIGHTDTVTSLSLSNCGGLICSNSLDKTLRIWNIMPFCSEIERCSKVIDTPTTNLEKNLIRCCWSPDDELVAVGSSDKNVYFFSVKDGELIKILGGHEGTVNDVDFNSTGRIIASSSSDYTAILGEY